MWSFAHLYMIRGLTLLRPESESQLPIRACIFDVDGLLIDSEDLLTTALNTILSRYSHSPLPWSIKTQLQGRTLHESAKLIIDWAKLPLTNDQFEPSFSYFSESCSKRPSYFPEQKNCSLAFRRLLPELRQLRARTMPPKLNLP